MFPNYKYLFFKDGWQDRGEVGYYEDTWGGKVPHNKEYHKVCGTDDCIHIGIEDNKPFRFCPKCMVKVM